MTRKLIGLLAALILLVPSGLIPSGSAQAAPAKQTTALLPKQAAKLYAFYFNPTQQLKSLYWTPTAAEVEAAEAALARYAKTPRPRMPKTFGQPKTFVLSKYNRQYAGIRYGGGMRQILINGFMNNYPVDPQWRWRAVLVFDGGTGFFHGIYNPQTRQIEQLDFNGPG